MENSFDFVEAQNFLTELMAPFYSACVSTLSDDIVFLKYENLADIGTLPVAAQTANHYLNLQHGDIALLNDPYSGGTVLSSVTVVMGIATEKQKGPANLLLSRRVQFKPRIYNAELLDQEGVRIPPSPYWQNGKQNIDLLKAIEQHPLCPENFILGIQKAADEMMQMEEVFGRINKNMKLNWSKPNIKGFLNNSYMAAKEKFNDIATGDQIVELEITKKCKIRLHLDVMDDRILCDFSGTDDSQEINLTDSATYGSCVGAIVSMFDQGIPLNSGVFQCIEARTPAGTIVNSKYPRPVFQGMTDGVALIANLVLKALNKIDRNLNMAISGTSQCTFDLHFSEKKHFYETLEPGLAASQNFSGTDGLSLWRRTHLNPSIEEIEERFPILLKSYSFRPNSGGSGQFQGGDGVTKSIIVKSPAKAYWFISEALHKPEGIEGGKSASGSEVFVTKSDGQRQRMDSVASTELESGDMITVHSAGGGGYGETEPQA